MANEEDELLMIASLQPSVAEQLAARLAEGNVEFELRAGDIGRGWEVQIHVPRSQIVPARDIEAAFVRASVPDLPPDYDGHATLGEDCPACGTPVVEGANECADCGLALPEVGTR